jgi:AcrR family transcriptional regulator
MANKTRSPEVIEFEKQRMSMVALEIIVKDGYNNLSIRKLSRKLNVSPSTIYNYFRNREEIYIYVLNKGFEMLLGEFQKAYDSHPDPVEKLKSVCRSVFSFSVRERDLALIMFVLDVPKYYDFVDTDYEPFMRIELDNALKCRDLIVCVMNDMAEEYPSFPKEDIPRCSLMIINQLIGLITIYNNKVMKYLTNDIEDGIELLLGEVSRPFELIRSTDAKKHIIAAK